MKALAVLAFLLGIMALLSEGTPRDTVTEHQTQAIAMNYAVYRNEVFTHVFVRNNRATGEIPLTALRFSSGWTTLRPWKARIAGDCLYIWGPASAEESSAIALVFTGSFAVGRARGGALVPGHGVTISIPAFVADESIVSVVNLN